MVGTNVRRGSCKHGGVRFFSLVVQAGQTKACPVGSGYKLRQECGLNTVPAFLAVLPPPKALKYIVCQFMPRDISDAQKSARGCFYVAHNETKP